MNTDKLSYLGQELRASYDTLAEEPLPERLARSVEALDRIPAGKLYRISEEQSGGNQNPNPDFLLEGRTFASAECRHGPRRQLVKLRKIRRP